MSRQKLRRITLCSGLIAEQRLRQRVVKSREPPITPHDLTAHICIGLRLPTSGGLWTWPFAKDERELKVRPQGQMAFNTITLTLDMAVADLCLAYLPQDTLSQHLATRDLRHVLAPWAPP